MSVMDPYLGCSVKFPNFRLNLSALSFTKSHLERRYPQDLPSRLAATRRPPFYV
jgi:hypothetical protein